MENITRKLHIKRTILIIIAFLWMCVVFFLSGQNGSASESTSSQFVNVIVDIYEKITCNELSSKNIRNVSFVVRKLAHFTLYFIGSIPVFMFFSTYNISKKRMFFCTLLFCSLYACSDEIHQFFRQDRNGNIVDVLIDTVGSVFGMIFSEIISNIVCSKIRRNYYECF